MILLTGFEPFNEFKINPSGMIAAETVRSYSDKVASEILPVDYDAVQDRLPALLAKHKPEMCICMGLAKGDTFRIETLASKPKEYEHLNGDRQYRSLIPNQVKEYCNIDPSFIISEDCGQYVCEAALWTLLNFTAIHNTPQTAFFLHVPAISNNWPYHKIHSTFNAFFNHAILGN